MLRIVNGVARFMAVLGGIVLVALILLVCTSVTGRVLNGVLHGPVMQSVAPGLADWLLALGVGPVNGDFELVEAGIAFAIFAFLPLCQVTSGHATVDVFTSHLPPRANRFLRMLGEILFAIALVVIAMQLCAGMQSKMRSHQTSFLLQFPIWWPYAASFAGSVIAAATGVAMAVVRVIEEVTGRVLMPDGPEADH